MSKTYEQGSFVEIKNEVLPANQRSENIPPDTQKTSLTMKVKGFLCHPAQKGDTVTIESVIGRKHTGVLVNTNPRHTHGFGDIVEELFQAQKSFKTFLKGGEKDG